MDLKQLAKQINQCTRCELRETATQPVPGVGKEGAEYFILGEAPGREEDLRNMVFIGLAGKRLDKLIALARIDPNSCYLTNLIHCRPPNNRTPRKAEIQACHDWIMNEIRLVKPKTIITLGSVPLKMFMPQGIREMHGCMTEIEIDCG